MPCFGWCPTAYWRDIGSPAAYRAAQIDLLDGRAACRWRRPGSPGTACWIAPDGTVEPERPDRRAVGGRRGRRAGRRVSRRAGSRASATAARIGPDAQVEGAILWERVEVGAGAVLQDCVIGADVRIGAGARVGPGVVLESGADVPERATLTR